MKEGGVRKKMEDGENLELRTDLGEIIILSHGANYVFR